MEKWLPIKGYEGLYEVSNLGRFRNIKRNKFRKLVVNRDGYLRINLKKDGAYSMKEAHRLVAQAFKKNPFNKPIVDHSNWDPTDNRAVNLRWFTITENNRHRRDRKIVSKLSLKDLDKMYRMTKSLTLYQIQEKTGINRSIIHHLLKYMHPKY